MYNIILDPNTNLLENIYSNNGHMIINNYLNFYIGGGNKISNDEKNEIDKLLKNATIYAPKKYFEGLTLDKVKERLKRMKKGVDSDHKRSDSYTKFKTDFKNGRRIQTKLSEYTNQWYKYFPNVKSIKEKSKITGVPLDIITKVFKRGLAAWRTGHRVGATAHQWGMARVHSFLVKGKTFWYTDRKLALEAMEKSDKARQWFDSIDGLCDSKKNRDKNTWCDTKNICNKIKCID